MVCHALNATIPSNLIVFLEENFSSLFWLQNIINTSKLSTCWKVLPMRLVNTALSTSLTVQFSSYFIPKFQELCNGDAFIIVYHSREPTKSHLSTSHNTIQKQMIFQMSLMSFVPHELVQALLESTLTFLLEFCTPLVQCNYLRLE